MPLKYVLSYNPSLFHDLWKHNCLKNQEFTLFFILRIMIMTKHYHNCEEYIMILDVISITYLSALLICLVAVIIPAYVYSWLLCDFFITHKNQLLQAP